jgi:heme exporter protein D
MNMGGQWTSAADFFFMGGYGLYVWGTFGVSLVLMVIEPLLARHRGRQALRDAAQAEVWKDSAL